MSDISKISLPVDVNGVPTPTEFNIKDPNAQPKTLATPITINGTTYTNLEAALAAINNKPSGGGGSIDLDTVDTENVMLVTSSEM